MTTNFKINDEVKSSVFGVGQIVDMDNTDNTIRVLFDSQLGIFNPVYIDFDIDFDKQNKTRLYSIGEQYIPLSMVDPKSSINQLEPTGFKRYKEAQYVGFFCKMTLEDGKIVCIEKLKAVHTGLNGKKILVGESGRKYDDLLLVFNDSKFDHKLY